MFPNTFISPSAKFAVCIFPITIVWRQITPWCTSAQNPENAVDELAIVAGISAPRALTT
jgi:hypothetical protein